MSGFVESPSLNLIFKQRLQSLSKTSSHGHSALVATETEQPVSRQLKTFRHLQAEHAAFNVGIIILLHWNLLHNRYSKLFYYNESFYFAEK